MDYALLLLIPLLMGIYIGQWLDQKTGHSPWFMLGGMLLGMVMGFGSLYKKAITSTPPKETPSEDKPDTHKDKP